MVNYIVRNFQSMGTIHTNSSAESIMEATTSHIGWGLLCNFSYIQEHQRVARVIKVCPAFLTSTLELDTGNTCLS